MSSGTTIVWYRNDRRVADHAALRAAVKRGRPVIPVYIWAPHEEGNWPPGGAAKWWMHGSLHALDAELRKRGSRLIVRDAAGRTSLDLLRELAEATQADAVYWQRRYEPAIVERDTTIKQSLKDDGIEACSFAGHLLYEPGSVLTKQDTPYTVFTPFWKASQTLPEPDAPESAPSTIPSPKTWPSADPIDELGLLPTIHWDTGMASYWQVGEAAGHERLAAFIDEAMAEYRDDRNRPGVDGSSRLSPYLAHGELSPRQIWHAIGQHIEGHRSNSNVSKSGWSYLREIGWREFAYHMLFFHQQTATEPWRGNFVDFPWRDDSAALRRWQRGQTGYPIVDAGMRQLWKIGWMHNRVRMIAASFLTKDLLIPWQHGSRWFWDTLVDADLANNTMGWQWTAGCGADAAPYFRIFNPVTQAERFDPDAAYVKQWCPELIDLPDKFIQHPWDAPPAVLREAGVALGETYPQPLVDHREARTAALDAFHSIK